MRLVSRMRTLLSQHPPELQDNSIVESTEPESVPDFEDLLQLDSTSVSSQDTSSIEIEFDPESEGQLDNANCPLTDIFLEHVLTTKGD